MERRVNSPMVALEGGVRRVTFPLPLGIDHVHCYLLPGSDGGWTVVDAGLGVADAGARWQHALDELEGPVTAVAITHLHPDHVGAAADLAKLTEAPVYQGAEDYEQCVRVWGGSSRPVRMPAYLRTHGVPEDEIAVFKHESATLAGMVRFVRDPEELVPGSSLHGWEVLHLPGHADGHLALLRDGVLIAGDALLASITPNVGLYPDSRPDPLGDYLESLGRIAELAPRVAYGGHGAAIDDPAGRARELIAHHDARLGKLAGALRGPPRTAYELSFALWPEPLVVALRRFAFAETRAHVEYLVLRDSAARVEADGLVRYAALT
jgi:glyoxylase-like metal-dependent hydrolase (beta-lactamase superfamily II)